MSLTPLYPPSPSPEALVQSDALKRLIAQEIQNTGGWISFARFMALALYTPGLGYYMRGAELFGASGDFVTSPEISPLFAQTLARTARQAMRLSAPCVLEVGAGSGRLARDLLDELERLDALPESYLIHELSDALRARQQATLAAGNPRWMNRIAWVSALPNTFNGFALANEVLDAMPVHRVCWGNSNDSSAIFERGIGLEKDEFAWRDKLATGRLLDYAQRLASECALSGGYVSEIGLAALSWIRSWHRRLGTGVLLLIDYGFARRERYHPLRRDGSLRCHYRHTAHDNPFYLPGLQDMTAHVDFSAIAEAAREAALDVLGWVSQSAFLMNAGILDGLSGILETHGAASAPYLEAALAARKLLSPSGMGELFQVMALGKGMSEALPGFSRNDGVR